METLKQLIEIFQRYKGKHEQNKKRKKRYKIEPHDKKKYFSGY